MQVISHSNPSLRMEEKLSMVLELFFLQECKLISCSNEVTEKVPVHSGKRYSEEISLCTECCYNDTCNVKGCGGSAIDPGKLNLSLGVANPRAFATSVEPCQPALARFLPSSKCLLKTFVKKFGRRRFIRTSVRPCTRLGSYVVRGVA